jgi:hypothetical protein
LSFWKYYVDLCKFLPFCKNKKIYNLSKKEIKEIPIDSPIYRGKNKFSFIKQYIYKQALYLVKKELDQACEGMYHNLCSLQSRSGNQLKWLFA